MPEMGPSRKALGADVRVLLHGKYAVYYLYRSEVVILRVLHGARDVTAIAERGGFDVDQ